FRRSVAVGLYPFPQLTRCCLACGPVALRISRPNPEGCQTVAGGRSAAQTPGKARKAIAPWKGARKRCWPKKLCRRAAEEAGRQGHFLRPRARSAGKVWIEELQCGPQEVRCLSDSGLPLWHHSMALPGCKLV